MSAAPQLGNAMEAILRNPAVLKQEGEFTDDTAAKWAWFAHGGDTGMEAFYSLDQMRSAVAAVLEHFRTPGEKA